MDHRPRMTQEHNAFFPTAASFCGELKEIKKEDICCVLGRGRSSILLGSLGSELGTRPSFGHHFFRELQTNWRVSRGEEQE